MLKKKGIKLTAGALAILLAGCGAMEYSGHVKQEVAGTKNAASPVVFEEEEIDEEKLNDLVGNLETEEKEIDKDETVYLITDATGEVTKTIVSEHLINADGKATIEDVSNLKDIENVEGDEAFSQNGDKLTWKAEGSDIYYQGTTDAQAPLSQKVTYTLNGKKVSADKLAGASGKVKIRFDYENHTSYTEEVDGKKVEVSVPLAAITCIMIPEGWSNVHVSNGQVLASGSSELVVGYCVPGLKKSLGIKDKDLTKDMEIPEYFEVEADVEDFSLSTCMTAVVNAGNTLTAKKADTSSIDEMLNTFGDAGDQLADGSKELTEGLDTLKAKLPEFANGMSNVESGSKELQNGLDQLNSKVPTLAEGVDQLKTGADRVVAGNQQILAGYTGDGTAENPGLKAGAQNVAAGAAQVKDGVDQTVESMETLAKTIQTKKAGILSRVNTALSGAGISVSSSTELQAVLTNPQVAGALSADAVASLNQAVGSLQVLETMEATVCTAESQQKLTALKTGAGNLSDGAKQVSDGVNTVAAGTEKLQAGLEQLDAGAGQLAANVPALSDGTNQLAAGSKKLSSGATQLNNATGQIVDGVNKLDEGSHQLSDGMVEFDESGIKKLLSAYDGDIKPVINRLEVAIDASEDYQSFAGIKEGVNGRVKFVYKMSAIEAK